MPRKTGKIPSNKTVLIVVEGKTEQRYFSEMKSIERIPGITIIPKQAKHSSLESILKTALDEKKSNVYDSVWCVFDYDTILEKGISEKTKKLKAQVERSEIYIADSLPSFEIWFLLHYVIPQKYYHDQNTLIKELYKYFPEYEKAICTVYSKLKDLNGTAIRNSYALLERNKQNHDKHASFCNVYKIFEELKLVKR
ncbi:RloB domain-containing protein [Treponema sp. OMZ 788]|uniref:RloB family protein n=1 Tax=Treponema sp. OMZ 788 TaxID=2563664 RepID=UPI0020A28441|nr:RloB family protein [Treponema sp. OMZ 788]UTC64124.1 RloB domain-containing protein [Treponema sp. OMZ 788]